MSRAMKPSTGPIGTVFATVLTALLLAVPAPAQERFEFGDFVVSCEDGVCRAATESPLGVADPNFKLVVERGADAPDWVASLRTLKDTADPNRPINYSIDGSRAVTLYPGGGYAAFESADRLVLIDPSISDRFLDNLAAGGRVRFSYLDIGGAPHDARFSLAGITASLLKIDELQGRTGDSRRIGAPAGETPLTGGDDTAARVALGVPDAVLYRHANQSDCEDPNSDVLKDVERIIAPLSNTATLYGIPCFAGAYNLAFRFYIAERGEIGGVTPQYFADYSDAFGWTGTEVLVNAAFDPQTGELTSFSKGRGLGDCGSAGVWKWQDYAFRMMEFRAWSACGDNGRTPENWPVVYSAE